MRFGGLGLDVSAIPAFIESRQALFERCIEHLQGYSSGSLWRHFGDGLRFIALHRSTEDAEHDPSAHLTRSPSRSSSTSQLTQEVSTPTLTLPVTVMNE